MAAGEPPAVLAAEAGSPVLGPGAAAGAAGKHWSCAGCASYPAASGVDAAGAACCFCPLADRGCCSFEGDGAVRRRCVFWVSTREAYSRAACALARNCTTCTQACR